MDKRIKRSSVTGIWRGLSAEIALLLLLTAVLALMLQKGTIGFKELNPGLALVCLVAGSAGVLWGPKGEAGDVKRLVACGIPAAAMLLGGFILRGEERVGMTGLIHGCCLIFPCLVSLAAERRKKRRGAAGRKRKRFEALRR